LSKSARTLKYAWAVPVGICYSSVKRLDFVNFLTFDESYNVKLVFYSVKLVSIALLLAVGLDHTHTTPQETNSITEGNAIYRDFTKLDEWRFLLARINRANSHWSLPPHHTTYYYI